MPKARTTISIDDQVLTAVRVRAARTGRADGDVIEDALRAYLGLDLFAKLWAHNDLDEAEAMTLAREAQQSVRAGRR